MECPANIADNVSNATDCEYSEAADQDFLNTNPITVNAEEFFGQNDWTFVGKDETGGQSGSFDFSSFAGSVGSQLMVVFKSGNGTTLVGYLISGLTGNWTSPFENPPFNVRNTKDVSHISLYTRGEIPGVPLPAAGFLLIGGLGALAMNKRRRKA